MTFSKKNGIQTKKSTLGRVTAESNLQSMILPTLSSAARAPQNGMKERNEDALDVRIQPLDVGVGEPAEMDRCKKLVRNFIA